jgi:DNA-binding LytR/AlgR family response regulator
MSPVSSDIFVLTVTLYFIVLLFSFVLLVRRTFVKENTIETMNKEKLKEREKSFTVRSNRQMKTLLYDHVLYIESMGDYVKINLQDGETVVTKEKISKLENRLPDSFVRIHRSFIVHQQKVSTLTRESIQIGEHSLPISRTFKNSAWEKLTKN